MDGRSALYLCTRMPICRCLSVDASVDGRYRTSF
uniref:Uncharacterized protein n=1 Tax=Anguilla anguilla TaxID=7936 RepID=A0A0E9VB83_ANGAN